MSSKDDEIKEYLDKEDVNPDDLVINDDEDDEDTDSDVEDSDDDSDKSEDKK